MRYGEHGTWNNADSKRRSVALETVYTDENVVVAFFSFVRFFFFGWFVQLCCLAHFGALIGKGISDVMSSERISFAMKCLRCHIATIEAP